jgi:hypothetical protein
VALVLIRTVPNILLFLAHFGNGVHFDRTPYIRRVVQPPRARIPGAVGTRRSATRAEELALSRRPGGAADRTFDKGRTLGAQLFRKRDFRLRARLAQSGYRVYSFLILRLQLRFVRSNERANVG